MSATYMNGGLFDGNGNPVSLATNGLPIISGVVEDAASANADPGYPILVVRRDTAAVGSGTDGDYSFASCDSGGRVYTNVDASAAEDAAHSSGDKGMVVLTKRTDTAAVSSGTDGDYSTLNVDANGKVWAATELTPVTVGGLSTYKNLDTGVTGDVVKSGAGQVYAIDIFNLGGSSASAFVKFYNKATAPTQADTPVMTIGVPTAGSKVISVPHGIAFSAGISVRATTAVATNSTAAPATNDVVVNVLYK